MQTTPIIPADCTNIRLVPDIHQLLAGEFTQRVNCFGMPLELPCEQTELISAVKTEMIRLRGQHSFGPDKYKRMVFKPMNVSVMLDLNDPARKGLKFLSDWSEFLSSKGFGEVQLHFESVGGNFTGEVQEFYPHHHWGDYKKGSVLFVIGNKGTLSWTPDSCKHLSHERHEPIPGHKPTEAPLGHLFRFANAPSHMRHKPEEIDRTKPWVHQGQPAGDKILLIG